MCIGVRRTILKWDPNLQDLINFSFAKVHKPSTKVPSENKSITVISPSIEIFLTGFINKLIHLMGDRFLVLVNYHLIYDARIHRMIEYLIDYLPSNFHLIISSYVIPSLQIARLRARRELLDIGPQDLQ